MVPPFDAAMQTIPPIESAVTKYGSGAVQPRAQETRQVNKSVATVMPETGLKTSRPRPSGADEQ